MTVKTISVRFREPDLELWHHLQDEKIRLERAGIQCSFNDLILTLLGAGIAALDCAIKKD